MISIYILLDLVWASKCLDIHRLVELEALRLSCTRCGYLKVTGKQICRGAGRLDCFC